MSWKDHVARLEGSGKVSHACICDFDGNVWAESSGLGCQKDQLVQLAQGMNAADGIIQGFSVGSHRFVFIGQEPGRTIRGCLKGGKKGGVIVCKTNKALVVGVYSEPTTGGEASVVVENLADYLRGVNF